MKTILTAEWAPHFEVSARRLAQVCTFTYCMGWAMGAWVYRLNDQLAGRTTPAPVIIQRQAADDAPGNIAPPTLAHLSDPMARAVRLVRDGKSQRLAASICGVSRSSLQRALKA